MSEPYVSKETAAAHLGVAPSTIKWWVHYRRIPFHKVGRLVRFRISELDDWVAQCTAEAQGDRRRR